MSAPSEFCKGTGRWVRGVDLFVMRDPSEWIAREDNSFGTGIVVTNRINVRRYGPKLEDPIVPIQGIGKKTFAEIE